MVSFFRFQRKETDVRMPMNRHKTRIKRNEVYPGLIAMNKG